MSPDSTATRLDRRSMANHPYIKNSSHTPLFPLALSAGAWLIPHRKHGISQPLPSPFAPLSSHLHSRRRRFVEVGTYFFLLKAAQPEKEHATYTPGHPRHLQIHCDDDDETTPWAIILPPQHLTTPSSSVHPHSII